MNSRFLVSLLLLSASLVFAIFQSDFEFQKTINQEVTSSPLASEMATVSSVIDGDTIELDDGRVVRYIGIDTPEKSSPFANNQCYSHQATDINTALTIGKTVRLERDTNDTDKYGRLLRYVWVDDLLVNQELVEQGAAFAKSYPPDTARQEQFAFAQQNAQQQKKGLWIECRTRTNAAGTYFIDDSEPTVNTQMGSLLSPTPVISLDSLPTINQEQVAGATMENVEVSSQSCTIKGNISANGKLYHVPGCPSYKKVLINQDRGEKLFCTENEAILAGWQKSSDCI